MFLGDINIVCVCEYCADVEQRKTFTFSLVVADQISLRGPLVKRPIYRPPSYLYAIRIVIFFFNFSRTRARGELYTRLQERWNIFLDRY